MREFIEQTIEKATEDGYVTTLFGRKRRIPELRSRQWQTRSLGERLAVNTVIQGTRGRHHQGRDGALPRTRCATPGLGTRLVLQIHDELLFEAPAAEVEAAAEIVVREMADAYRARPAAGRRRRLGENWLAAK